MFVRLKQWRGGHRGEPAPVWGSRWGVFWYTRSVVPKFLVSFSFLVQCRKMLCD